MPGMKRILVTTDFSDASRQAFPVACELARRLGASLTLAYVFPTTLPAELSHIGIIIEQRGRAAEARQRLARFRERELPMNQPIDLVILEGGPAHEICTFARDAEMDLILTATHGHTGLKHLWLGSTVERIVRHAPCPVLVVREQVVPLCVPAEVPCRFQRIVVPVDFSEAGRPALRSAEAFALACSGEVTLVHVIEPPPYPEFGYAHIPTREAGLKHSAAAKLGELQAELGLAGVTAGTVIRTGAAYHEITAVAREQNAGLIVIATQGRGALAHALLGSTAERVVRHAPCPVLVVRSSPHR